MPMRIRQFLSGRHFKRIFMTVYILLMFFAAYETKSALETLTAIPYGFRAVYVLFGAAAALLITRNYVAQRHSGRIYHKITSFLSCFLIYYLLLFLGLELCGAVFRLNGRSKAVGVVAAAGAAALIVLLGYLHTKAIVVKRYTVPIGLTATPYRIALISDIHLGIFVEGEHIRRMAEKINGLAPDIVVIAGDIFDVDNSLLGDEKRLEKISGHLSEIKTREGVYAVLGNHDPKVNNPVLRNFLKDSGIELLDDEVKVLSGINLIGRADVSDMRRCALGDLLSKGAAGKPVVVLDHNPEGIGEAVRERAELVLCGHTHRGQLFPVSLLTRWANGKGRFYGYGTEGESRYVITSGVGFFALPVRVGTDNEVVSVILEDYAYS